MTSLRLSWIRSTSPAHSCTNRVISRAPRCPAIALFAGLLLILVIGSAGCRSHAPAGVRVNLGQIVAAQNAADQAAAAKAAAQVGKGPGSPVKAGSSAIPAETDLIPGDPAMPAEDSAIGAAANVKEAIEREEATSRTAVLARLKSFYLRQILEQTSRSEAKLSAEQAAQRTQLERDISAKYQDYARRRFPVVAELSAIVGFPDRDPTGKRPAGDTMRARDRLNKRATELRNQLSQMDQEFDLYAAEKTNALDAAHSLNRKALEDALAADRADIDRKAAAAADRILSLSAANMLPLITSKLAEILPPVEGAKVSLPASSMKLPAAAPPSNAPTPAEVTARHQAAAQALTIWLRLNGYRLSESSTAPDKTSDFAKWLKTYLPATSTSP